MQYVQIRFVGELRFVVGEANSLPYDSVIMHVTDSQQMRQLKEDLLADTDIMMVSSAGDVLEQFSTITENLGAVVAILIISAGLLALVVLYNLSNINITERNAEGAGFLRR